MLLVEMHRLAFAAKPGGNYFGPVGSDDRIHVRNPFPPLLREKVQTLCPERSVNMSRVSDSSLSLAVVILRGIMIFCRSMAEANCRLNRHRIEEYRKQAGLPMGLTVTK
jgi:hypothetical protein